MTLDEARDHIGAGVVYNPGHGRPEDGEGGAMLAMTNVTRRILRQAQQRGFRVRTSLAGGRVIHYLDQHGQDGSFGAVYVGQRTGRITGAVLHRGNADAAGTRYRGALATGRAIRETAARPAGFVVWSKDKQAANEARSWPDWRGRSEDEAIEHERKPRCYIAGPIAGVPDFRDRFATAATTVEAMGYEPVNPCDIQPSAHAGECPPGYDPGDAGAHASSACFMRADLRALLDCDAIYMLPGWRESRGATAEHTVAVACGIPVL